MSEELAAAQERTRAR